MFAAVVRSFDHPPRYEAVDAPLIKHESEVLVDVLAAGLHPRVRSGASDTHYLSAHTLPLIPGIDGVGRLSTGQTIYFAASDPAHGTMAEQAVVNRRLSVPLPDGVDPITIAAGMNPAMSSWLALRKRIHFEPGQRVLVLGATGNAGQLAVQIAKHLGAAQVIAAGRDPGQLDALRALGADTTVSLAGDPQQAALAVGEAAAEVDVVIDYVWGQPAERIMPALINRRSSPGQALQWIHIGSTAGAKLDLDSELLRKANLWLLGSGQGSLSTEAIVSELPALVQVLASGGFAVNAKSVPLSEVETRWNAPAVPGQRIVFVPGF
jgi:NADPH:quinone reductase-like Zn-dependent oxidoreductase